MDVSRRKLFGFMALSSIAAASAASAAPASTEYRGIGYIRGAVKPIVSGHPMVLKPSESAVYGPNGPEVIQTITLKLDSLELRTAINDALASIQVVDSEDDEAPTVDGGAGI